MYFLYGMGYWRGTRLPMQAAFANVFDVIQDVIDSLASQQVGGAAGTIALCACEKDKI